MNVSRKDEQLTSQERIKHLILGLVGGLIAGMFTWALASVVVETSCDIGPILIGFPLIGAYIAIRYQGGQGGIWIVSLIAFGLFSLSSMITIAYAIRQAYELDNLWGFTLSAVGVYLVWRTIVPPITQALWFKNWHDNE